MWRAGIAFGVCCLFLNAGALAQQQRADSLHASARAHASQAHFERIRRDYSPSTNDAAPSCEIAIGRMCYWNDDGDREVPPEPRPITRARRALTATLDTLTRLSPADDWIRGELVHYLVQADRDSEAVAAAQPCVVTSWSCRLLLGYALHASGRYGDASAQFDSALASMPTTERCRWNDISLLLGDDQRDAYTRIPCGQRDSAERRFWELTQPSFVVAGNDRRTEHFSRVLLSDLSRSAANVYGMAWGPDLSELLIRYGEPRWYSLPWQQRLDPVPSPLGHNRSPSFHFTPEMENGAARWDVYDRTARERYAPAYIDTVTDLDVQFAMMKRGDSALVLAVYGGGVTGNAALGVTDSPVSHNPAPQSDRVRRTRSAWKAEMVAMEVLDTAHHVDARAREWLEPPAHVPGAPDISTLLLYDPDSAAIVQSLDDALGHALTVTDLRNTRRIGLYWEVYGDAHNGDTATAGLKDDSARAPASDSGDVAVTVVRTDGGILRWLGSALHISPRDAPLSVRWHNSKLGESTDAHSLVLDLARLPAGTYRIVVDAGPDSTHRTETSREITIH